MSEECVLFPPYSVVIPAFNAAGTLGEAIHSILDQVAKPSEILIVDDGSTDQTAIVAAAAGPIVSVIRQENAGSGAATTRGIRESRCGVIALLDADDVWLPLKMTRQLTWLSLHQETAGVFCGLQLFGNLSAAGEIRKGWTRSTMVIRREVFDTVGPVIDPPGNRGEMVDWIARVREAGFRLDLLPDNLVRRRVRTDSLSYGRDPIKDRGYLHVARRAILRRRQAGNTSL